MPQPNVVRKNCLHVTTLVRKCLQAPKYRFIRLSRVTLSVLLLYNGMGTFTNTPHRHNHAS